MYERDHQGGEEEDPLGQTVLFVFFTILNPAKHLPAVSRCVRPSGGRKKTFVVFTFK